MMESVVTVAVTSGLLEEESLAPPQPNDADIAARPIRRSVGRLLRRLERPIRTRRPRPANALLTFHASEGTALAMAVSVSMSGDAEVSVRVEVTAPPVPTTGELKEQASPVGRPEGQLRASPDGERAAEPLGVIVTVTAPVPDGDRVSAEGLIVVVNGSIEVTVMAVAVPGM